MGIASEMKGHDHSQWSEHMKSFAMNWEGLMSEFEVELSGFYNPYRAIFEGGNEKVSVKGERRLHNVYSGGLVRLVSPITESIKISLYSQEGYRQYCVNRDTWVSDILAIVLLRPKILFCHGKFVVRGVGISADEMEWIKQVLKLRGLRKFKVTKTCVNLTFYDESLSEIETFRSMLSQYNRP